MTRMTMDCRTMPSESGCSLVLVGEEDEVLRAAVAHAVDVHGHTDGDDLRNGLRASLTEAPLLELAPGAFVQLIDLRTDRVDEVVDLAHGWAEAIGSARTARWEVLGVDRNNQGQATEVERVPTTRNVERCRHVEEVREATVGYDVRYVYNGRELTARLPENPGPRLRVAVDVRPTGPDRPNDYRPGPGPSRPRY